MGKFTAVGAAALLFASTGCATLGLQTGVSVYTDLTVEQSFRTLDKPSTGGSSDAHGEACASSILGIVTTGNAGFDYAYKAALASTGATSLWDVRADTHWFSILGLYTSKCTLLTGKISK